MEAVGGRGTEAGRGQNHEENNAQQLLEGKTWRLRGHKARRLTENNAWRLRGGQNAEPPAAPSPEAGGGTRPGPPPLEVRARWPPGGAAGAPLGAAVAVGTRRGPGGCRRRAAGRGGGDRPRGRAERSRGPGPPRVRARPRGAQGAGAGGMGGWGCCGPCASRVHGGGSRPQVAPSPSCPLPFAFFNQGGSSVCICG